MLSCVSVHIPFPGQSLSTASMLCEGLVLGAQITNPIHLRTLSFPQSLFAD